MIMTISTRSQTRQWCRSCGIVAAALIVVAGTVTAETLRLDAAEAARRAVEVSSLVEAADARVQAAGSSVEAADAGRLPEVSVAAALGRRSAVPELAAPLAGPDQPLLTIFPNIETTYSTMLSVEQPVYTGGALSASRRAARHQQAAAGADRDTIRAETALAARLAYWSTVAARAGREAATAQQRRAERLLADARAMLAAGMAVDADVLAAEARLAAARVQVIRRTTELEDGLAGLRSLLHLPPATEIELADGPASPPPDPPEPAPSLTTRAIGQRAEVAALDSRVKALSEQELAVAAERRPGVALAAQWDLSRPNNRYLPLADEWNDSWSVGVTARWKVFDGHRSSSRAAELGHQREALAAERSELLRRITLEVDNGCRDLGSALATVTAADAALRAARAREHASNQRYDAGLAPIAEVLDAQAELADAELEQVSTRAAAWIAAARLQRAVGP